MQLVKQKLQSELNKYLNNKVVFEQYYPGMNVVFSSSYKEQLQEAIDLVKKHNADEVRSFELYLDTIIINMHTKMRKYKKSIYFDDENIKDIQNQGFTIVVYIDEKTNIYVLLGLVNSQ